MWYSTTTNKYIQDGTKFELDGITYPNQWLSQATPEQKEAIGLQEVIATNSPKSDQYYWVSTELVGANLTYNNIPKDLDMIKTMQIAQIRSTAYSMLFPTDWMVVKSIETSVPMSSEWAEWRNSIRVTSDEAIIAIENATDVDGVSEAMSNVVWPSSPLLL